MKAVLRTILLVFICASIGIGLFLWRDREMVQNELLDRAIAKLAPQLPFQVISYRLSKKLDYFEMHLQHQGVPISIAGPLVLSWVKKEGMSILFSPELIYGDSTPLRLSVKGVISRKLQIIDGLTLEIAPQDFEIKSQGLKLSQLKLQANYRKPSLALELAVSSVGWASLTNANRAVSISGVELKINAPQSPLLSGTDLSFNALGSEVLWDKIYADLNLKEFPLALKAEDENTIKLELGKKTLLAKIERNEKQAWLERQSIHFQTGQIPIAPILPYLIRTFASTIPALSNLSDFEMKRGTLRAEGSLEHGEKSGFTVHAFTGSLKEASLRSLRFGFSAQGLNFTLPYRGRDARHSLNLKASQLHYKHFEGALSDTRVEWSDQEVIIPRVPLQIKNVPLEVGKVSVKLKPEVELTTDLNLPAVALNPVIEGLCLTPKKFPPASLQGRFKRISVSSSVIDTDGDLELALFKGKVKLNEFAVYDLNTEVPETDFDFEWSGIDMLSLGEWSKFGEIKGTLEGYAHEVVLQSSLPTHYRFLLQVVPLDRQSDRAQVEFSPEAMKNVVQVFTGTSLEEHMPGIAGWLMFGWPSRVFGGYDVNYAGIKLTSEDGHIVVETLDRPGIFERERKHFVLYGPRFKMPLRNSSYPLLIDATAMSNFVHQLTVQLESIKQKKEGNSDHEESTKVCDPPEI